MHKVWISLVSVVLVIALTSLAIGWYFSGLVRQVNHSRSYDIAVKAIGESSVTLAASGNTRTPGQYGLDFKGGGHMIVGAISSTTKTTVTRLLVKTDGDVKVNDKGSWDYNVWDTDPSALNLQFQDVNVSTPLGNMPAWYVPAGSGTWAIAIHGRDETRAEALRAIPTLIQQNISVLDITYRNDVGAPPNKDHADHLGATEWQDVQSAIQYGKAHGAQQFVLYGWSMGGALAMQTLHASPDAPLIKALVLDDPVMDWRATLDSQGGQHGLPLPLTRLAEQVYSWRTDFSFDEFDQNKHSTDVHTPILILHGRADTYVPGAATLKFAKSTSATTTLDITDYAKHTGSWNVDSANYVRNLSGFLSTQNFGGL